jgi:membrane protein YdbS with pleckstrin-like domain
MHWLALLMYAFLYAFVGSIIGLAYALLTGADTASLSNVMGFATVFGPVVVLVIAGCRKLARVRHHEVPITHAIYHTLLLTFAAPVFMYGGQLIAGAFDATKVARVFQVMKFWSIPMVFIFAVFYGIWRVVEGNRPRTASPTGGGPSGPTSTPPSGPESGQDRVADARSGMLRLALARVLH